MIKYEAFKYFIGNLLIRPQQQRVYENSRAVIKYCTYTEQMKRTFSYRDACYVERMAVKIVLVV